jgi:hypothetical protein
MAIIYISNGGKIDQMVIKYAKIFHCKTVQNLPKVGFLIRKQTIWQPCFYVKPSSFFEFEN